MKSLMFLFIFSLAAQGMAQNTFINDQGFSGDYISSGGLITEYDNHYYFTYGLSDIGISRNFFVIVKYDTSGKFISKNYIAKKLNSPSLKKSQMGSDSTFYTQFLKYGSSFSIAVIQKNDLNGTFKWNTSTSQYYDDFIYQGDSIFAVGNDTNTSGNVQQAIFSLNPITGSINKKRYFTDISGFKVSSFDSAFKVVEITAIDSSLFILFHRKKDSAKFIYEFDQKLNYRNHFKIENDAFRFLDNEKFLIVSHKWRTIDLVSKGRSVVYAHSGQILWKLEEHENNLDYLFSPGQAFIKRETLNFVVLNYDKKMGKGSAWRELIKMSFDGKILKRFKIKSDTYKPSVSSILPISNGYLIQAYYTDYETHIIKTDTCFNAQSDKYPSWVLEFPTCGELNNSLNFREQDVTNSIQVFPNPTSSNLTISTQNTIQQLYSLLDVNGRQVLSGNFSKQTQLDVSALKTGMYFLRIHNLKNGLVEKRKIIVGK